MKIIRFEDLVNEGRVQGRRVLIRSDLNVPLNDQGNISDDTRIRSSLEAIKMALSADAAVMVTSHLGRPTAGHLNPIESLKPVAERLEELLGMPVTLVQDWVEKTIEVQPGEVVLLENCRGNLGETENSERLSRKIASKADIYVNDAFGAAHRKHASTYGVAQFVDIACGGPLLMKEVEAISQVLSNPKRPLVAIVGGSKVSDKLKVLNKLAQVVDGLIVGGGIANTFMLASGLPIGNSLAEQDLVEDAKVIIQIMRQRGAEVPIPLDVVTAKSLDPDAQAELKNAKDILKSDMILDVGPQTARRMVEYIAQAGTIIWNGPVGVFEYDAFSAGTRVLAHAIAESSAYTLAGGGDTMAAIAKFGIQDKIDYISTGGGAFLEVLEGKMLPAIAILQERALQSESA